MKLFARCAAAMPLAITLAVPLPGFSTPASAAQTNWMREHVRQWESRMVERFVGREAAARLKTMPRIIGGVVAPAGRWPFQAGILTANIANNFNAQYCGASIIHARFALTAAHCVDFLSGPGKIHVLTNTQSLASGGARHAVEKFKFHPNWDPATSDYDIAVIKLKNEVSGISAAKRAKIISSVQEETQSAPPKEKAYVTGWGDTNPGAGETYATQLNEVQVPIVKRSICNAPASYDGEITSRMLCAGFAAGGKDSCQGDSGGPLVVRDGLDRWRLQVGVVSWGIGCALPDLYGVYSRLGVLGPWVLKTINNLL
jgi:secreted trypsin-like serine protease